MRTVQEVKEDADQLEDRDVKDEMLLAPSGMAISTVKFIVSAMEDDLDDESKRELFANCFGKNEEEITRLASLATMNVGDHAETQGV